MKSQSQESPHPSPVIIITLPFLKRVKKEKRKKILQNQPLNLPYTRLNSQRSAPSATCCFSPSEGTNNSNLFSRHEFHPISKRRRHRHRSSRETKLNRPLRKRYPNFSNLARATCFAGQRVFAVRSAVPPFFDGLSLLQNGEREEKRYVKEETLKGPRVRQKIFSSVCDRSILKIDFYRRREIIDVVNKKILCIY